MVASSECCRRNLVVFLMVGCLIINVATAHNPLMIYRPRVLVLPLNFPLIRGFLQRSLRSTGPGEGFPQYPGPPPVYPLPMAGPFQPLPPYPYDGI